MNLFEFGKAILSACQGTEGVKVSRWSIWMSSPRTVHKVSVSFFGTQEEMKLLYETLKPIVPFYDEGEEPIALNLPRPQDPSSA